jgi:hypothetical protein
MKRIILILIFTFLINICQSQTYKVINNPGLDSKELKRYQSAIDEADLSSFRLRNARQVIDFDNGLKVELFSATELIDLGKQINIEEYVVRFPYQYVFPTFRVTKEGKLLAAYKKIVK